MPVALEENQNGLSSLVKASGLVTPVRSMKVEGSLSKSKNGRTRPRPQRDVFKSKKRLKTEASVNKTLLPETETL